MIPIRPTTIAPAPGRGGRILRDGPRRPHARTVADDRAGSTTSPATVKAGRSHALAVAELQLMVAGGAYPVQERAARQISSPAGRAGVPSTPGPAPESGPTTEDGMAFGSATRITSLSPHTRRDPAIRVRPSRLLAAAAAATARAAVDPEPQASDDQLDDTAAAGLAAAPVPDRVDQLRAVIARIETQGSSTVGRDREPAGVMIGTGHAAIDARLGEGGLSLARLHEIVTAEAGDHPSAGAAHGAGLGLAASWAAAAARLRSGPVLWVGGWPPPYAPGLAGFGLDPSRLLVVPARRSAERLWVMEEAVRSGAVAAVVGEVADADPLATRRLQFAAAEGGALALMLRPVAADSLAATAAHDADPALLLDRLPASSAASRWAVTTAPGTGAQWPAAAGYAARPIGRLHWRLDLLRARGALPARFTVAWAAEGQDPATADRLDVIHGPGIGSPRQVVQGLPARQTEAGGWLGRTLTRSLISRPLTVG